MLVLYTVLVSTKPCSSARLSPALTCMRLPELKLETGLWLNQSMNQLHISSIVLGVSKESLDFVSP